MRTLARVVAPEQLDSLHADSPAAQRSRRDLVRVHGVMRTCAQVARAWQSLLAARAARTPLRVLEIGAGDGTLLLGVARRLASRLPPVHLTLLDRLDIVGPATLAGYAAFGWTARVEPADALDWAADAAAMPPGAPGRWDLITTTLFLHHFEGGQLAALLAGVASRADRFFACEPRRARLALAASHLVSLIGANAVTRGDGVLSVHAGLRAAELRALWPGTAPAWQTREFSAGLFSHGFSALRTGVHG